MRRSNTEIHPMDRVHIDGDAYLFLGQSDTGHLFVLQSDEDHLVAPRDIANDEMSELFSCGRLVIEREHFKSRSRK